MALTGWEAAKVAGHLAVKLGETGEAFENGNPGENWKPSKGEIVDIVVDTLTELGQEVLD